MLKLSGDAVGDDGPNGVDDVFAWQVVGLRDFGLASWFLMALPLHHFVTFLAQLHARSGMDGVVDAAVKRMETAQHLAVGRIDDGINAETGDVALS